MSGKDGFNLKNKKIKGGKNLLDTVKREEKIFRKVKKKIKCVPGADRGSLGTRFVGKSRVGTSAIKHFPFSSFSP